MLFKRTHLQRDRLVQYKASLQSKQSGSLEEYFRKKLDWQEIAIKEIVARSEKRRVEILDLEALLKHTVDVLHGEVMERQRDTEEATKRERGQTFVGQNAAERAQAAADEAFSVAPKMPEGFRRQVHELERKNQELNIKISEKDQLVALAEKERAAMGKTVEEALAFREEAELRARESDRLFREVEEDLKELRRVKDDAGRDNPQLAADIQELRRKLALAEEDLAAQAADALQKEEKLRDYDHMRQVAQNLMADVKEKAAATYWLVLLGMRRKEKDAARLQAITEQKEEVVTELNQVKTLEAALRNEIARLAADLEKVERHNAEPVDEYEAKKTQALEIKKEVLEVIGMQRDGDDRHNGEAPAPVEEPALILPVFASEEQQYEAPIDLPRKTATAETRLKRL